MWYTTIIKYLWIFLMIVEGLILAGVLSVIIGRYLEAFLPTRKPLNKIQNDLESMLKNDIVAEFNRLKNTPQLHNKDKIKYSLILALMLLPSILIYFIIYFKIFYVILCLYIKIHILIKYRILQGYPDIYEKSLRI